MKKFLSILMVLLLIVGCSSPAESAETKTVAVTSSGQSEGLELEVTFEGNEIREVRVVEHQETEGISDPAIDAIPKAIVEHNSIAVDVVSGATITSLGIIEGVKLAIEQAGLNVADFETEVSKEPSESKVTTLDADVVVVGAGIGGLAAGLEAALNGAKVIVLEKMPMTGGSTMMSGGLILAAESSISETLGNTETWEDLANYWYEVSEEQADKDFIDLAARTSGENIDWMIENGVDMKEEITKLHSSHEFAFGHRTAGFDDVPAGGGVGFTQPLTDKIVELGGEVLLQTPGQELIIEDDKVVGVKATNNNGDDITINAKAVVIATGGFAASDEYMKEHMPYLTAGSAAHNGNTGNTGDGLTMGEQADAKMLFHDSGINLGTNYPTYYGYGEEYTGLYVTPDGERFMNETEFHFVRTRKLMDLGFNDVWAITDQSNDRVEASVEAGQAFKADSLEELAELVGIDATALTETVTQYNALSEAGEDTDFNKDAQYMQAVEGPTYYALKLFMGNSGSIGGLVTTIDGEVLNNNDEIIEGLYAAGEVASGQLMYKEYPGSGSAIAMYLAFGRQAGRAAADYVK
jgi:fumarate reductase flavoprotein subunit